MDIGGLLQMLLGGAMGGGGSGGGGGQSAPKPPAQLPVQNVGQPSGWAQFGQGMQDSFRSGWGHGAGAGAPPSQQPVSSVGGGMGMDQLLMLLKLLQGGAGSMGGGMAPTYAPPMRDFRTGGAYT